MYTFNKYVLTSQRTPGAGVFPYNTYALTNQRSRMNVSDEDDCVRTY